MTLDFDEFLKFLINKKLSPNQFAICWMIEKKDIALVKEYQAKVGPFKKSDFEYLFKHGYIENFNAGDELDLANLIVMPKFTEEVFIDSTKAFDEILEIYPKQFKDDNGKVWSLLNADLGQLEVYYAKIIKGNRYKHEDILKKTKIVVERMKSGQTNYRGIGKFIRGHNWLEAEIDVEPPRDSFTNE